MNFGSQFIKKFDFFHKFRLFLTKNYDMIRILNRPGEKWEQCERLKKERCVEETGHVIIKVMGAFCRQKINHRSGKFKLIGRL